MHTSFAIRKLLDLIIDACLHCVNHFEYILQTKLRVDDTSTMMMLEGASKLLAERLRELRVAAGLSQEQLAGVLLLHKSTISLYENGRREPDAETMQRIAQYFHVSVDYLLGRTNAQGLPSEEELLAQLPPEVKAAFRGKTWHDLDPETRKHIAWMISMDLERLKAKRKEEESKSERTQ